MADRLTKDQRSRLMSRVRNRDTAPERRVRSRLHRLGLRFRTCATNLPGTPDVVLRRHNTVVFVHGCFWHGHSGCRRSTLPATNSAFWSKKIARNVARDVDARRALRRLGWRIVVIWECWTRDLTALDSRLGRGFKRRRSASRRVVPGVLSRTG